MHHTIPPVGNGGVDAAHHQSSHPAALTQFRLYALAYGRSWFPDPRPTPPLLHFTPLRPGGSSGPPEYTRGAEQQPRTRPPLHLPCRQECPSLRAAPAGLSYPNWELRISIAQFSIPFPISSPCLSTTPPTHLPPISDRPSGRTPSSLLLPPASRQTQDSAGPRSPRTSPASP